MVVNQLLKYGEFGIVLFDNFQVTERTRNQFVRKHTRVRIPLSPPKYKGYPKRDTLCILLKSIMIRNPLLIATQLVFICATRSVIQIKHWRKFGFRIPFVDYLRESQSKSIPKAQALGKVLNPSLAFNRNS